MNALLGLLVIGGFAAGVFWLGSQIEPDPNAG